MTDLIQTTVADGVMIIRLNRAEKKNALNREMYHGMNKALEKASIDEVIRAVVFAGVPGTFSAGNDIKDFMTIAEGGALPSETRDFLHQLAAAPKPTIAAVDGLAIGIGTTLLMHCDLAYASPRSLFRTPFLDLGLTPEAASSLIAPRLMGDQRAFALLVLGDAFDAQAAREAGLVYQITDHPEAEAQAAAARLAQKPPEALRIARDLLKGTREDIRGRLGQELEIFAERLRSSEARAAFAAFLHR
ncbi:crotonase/enoyl-CoA hydratase family protein [Jiella sp. MQZ9-1]|uniref:Crotonase/enoyl-CoA hydratase family protein n=1 Tax=Jiella flava TaxID=2816857 RepID=A0A939FUY8_9HYPH|nr:crotonase/enoyl-CoA hydratase family protein [Jiella flava]MBO0661276.1 crotonase/enoyl-CoA hydratase family protein [Jiella flava]MCD2469921.1 crotonase/enoyl-CoA hydratase family protein [Jiella flava]